MSQPGQSGHDDAQHESEHQAEERDDEIVGLRALARAGAGGLRTGQQWESWLRRAACFADYGFTNTMLIWAQQPDAIQVRDYQGWRHAGRQVIRGEQGIRLILPARRQRKASPDTGAERVGVVFDLMQTTGNPVPIHDSRKPTSDSWQTLVSLGMREGFRVRSATSVGADIGSPGDVITVHNDLEEQPAVLALIRAVAHMLLYGAAPAMGTGTAEDRGLAGYVQAESVSYLIAQRLGANTSTFAFPPVTSWAGNDPRSPAAGIVTAAGERVISAARRAFTCIDQDSASSGRLVTGPRLACVEQAPVTRRTDAVPSRTGRIPPLKRDRSPRRS